MGYGLCNIGYFIWYMGYVIWVMYRVSSFYSNITKSLIKKKQTFLNDQMKSFVYVHEGLQKTFQTAFRVFINNNF